MDAIIKEYKKHGVDKFYRLHRHDYINPHIDIVENLIFTAKSEWNINGNILDLCCGSGEVSACLNEFNVEGLDPYTYKIYQQNTDNNCIQMTFKDIVQFGLERTYDFIICSYALHLCEKSMLPLLLYQLGSCTRNLIVITPHKKPECSGEFFREVSKIKYERTTMKLYKSKIFNESFCFM